MAVLSALLAVACLAVLFEAAVLLRHLGHLRGLGASAPPPARWPRVSVIIAARDEARDVGAAVASHLADDYPELELIVVDDRSGDGTGGMAARAAAGDRRFTLVRIDELPDGWLGKVHAMERGWQRATGEWVLFSDADVKVRPGTLRRAVSHCLAEGLDLLALAPAIEEGSALIDAVWTVFLGVLMVLVDPRAVRSARSGSAMGVGAFDLVRRGALECTSGLADLRMETGDDVALALMVKRAGGRVELLGGGRHLSVPMYRSVSAFLEGMEKHASHTAAMPLPAFAAALALIWWVVLGPVLALLLGPFWLRLLGATALLLHTAGEVATLRSNAHRWASALLWPLGALLFSYGLARATWLARRNGGVRWRGTFYPLSDLARGRRIAP